MSGWSGTPHHSLIISVLTHVSSHAFEVCRFLFKHFRHFLWHWRYDDFPNSRNCPGINFTVVYEAWQVDKHCQCLSCARLWPRECYKNPRGLYRYISGAVSSLWTVLCLYSVITMNLILARQDKANHELRSDRSQIGSFSMTVWVAKRIISRFQRVPLFHIQVIVASDPSTLSRCIDSSAAMVFEEQDHLRFCLLHVRPVQA